MEAEQGGAAPPPRNMVTEDTANAIAPGVASATPAIPISEIRDPATALCLVAWKGLSPWSSVSEGDKLKVMCTPAPQMSHDRGTTGRHIPPPMAPRNLRQT